MAGRKQQEVKVKLELTEGYRTRFTEAVCRQLLKKKGSKGDAYTKTQN